MTHPFRNSALPAALLAAALTLTACGGDEESTAPAADESAAEQTAAGDGVEDHNDADVEFTTGMIPHHAQAVEMSDMVAEKEGSALTDLAEQISAAQGPEIETMTQWLTAWGEDVPETGGGHDMGSMDGMEMGGMMSEEDMDSLMQMNGADFDVMWLEMMTEHHEGAIEMAQTQVDEGQNADAIDLAEDIIASQQAEIEQMQEMLTELTG